MKILVGAEGSLKSRCSFLTLNGEIHPIINDSLKYEVDFWEQLPEVFRIQKAFQVGCKVAWLPLQINSKKPFYFTLKKDIRYLDFNIEQEIQYRASIQLGIDDFQFGARVKLATTNILKYKFRQGNYNGCELYSKVKLSGNFYLKMGIKKIKVFDVSLGYSPEKREVEIVCSSGMGLELSSYGLLTLPMQVNASVEGSLILKVKIKVPEDFQDLSNFNFDDSPLSPIDEGGFDGSLIKIEDLFDKKKNYKKRIKTKLKDKNKKGNIASKPKGKIKRKNKKKDKLYFDETKVHKSLRGQSSSNKLPNIFQNLKEQLKKTLGEKNSGNLKR